MGRRGFLRFGGLVGALVWKVRGGRGKEKGGGWGVGVSMVEVKVEQNMVTVIYESDDILKFALWDLREIVRKLRVTLEHCKDIR